MLVGKRIRIFVHVAQSLGAAAEAAYSPKCPEEEICELRLYRFLGSQHSCGPLILADSYLLPKPIGFESRMMSCGSVKGYERGLLW
jgi:hypothetical protein